MSLLKKAVRHYRAAEEVSRSRGPDDFAVDQHLDQALGAFAMWCVTELAPFIACCIIVALWWRYGTSNG